MDAAFPFDIKLLLLPISKQAPSGESLAYDGLYDQIRDARRSDDAALDQGVWQTSLKKADWDVVEKLAIEALQKRTKDLQIGAWLLEAWLHQYGLPGVREGVRLQTALCAKFWDDVHPQTDGADLEARLGPIVWMNDKIPNDLKLLPIAIPAPEEVASYCWADWEAACRPKPAPTGRNRAPVDEGVTQQKFQQSAMLTPTPVLVSMVRDLEAIMDACTELESVLDEKCGQEAPSLRQFWTILEPIHGLLLNNLGQRETSPQDFKATDDRNPEQPSQAAAAEAQAPGMQATDGRILSRADAYRRLAEVAEYLAKTEPHSPTPYLVRRAIFWGSMKLDELLPELVRDRGELTEIYRLLQIGKGS